MISAGLGIGVVPLAACHAQVGALGLKVVRLRDTWAKRRLLLGSKRGALLPPAPALLFDHLVQRAGEERRRGA
jgi:DNA-binding transcriptional LysR family regulator